MKLRRKQRHQTEESCGKGAMGKTRDSDRTNPRGRAPQDVRKAFSNYRYFPPESRIQELPPFGLAAKSPVGFNDSSSVQPHAPDPCRRLAFAQERDDVRVANLFQDRGFYEQVILRHVVASIDGGFDDNRLVATDWARLLGKAQRIWGFTHHEALAHRTLCQRVSSGVTQQVHRISAHEREYYLKENISTPRKGVGSESPARGRPCECWITKPIIKLLTITNKIK